MSSERPEVTKRNVTKDYSDHIKLLMGGRSQAAFAAVMKVSAMAVNKWVNRASEPTAAVYMRLASLAAGTEQEGFFLRQATQKAGFEEPAKVIVKRNSARQEEMTISWLDVTGKAGNGWVNDTERNKGELKLPRKLLPITGRPIAINASGDSMEPTIESGMLVIVDTTRCRVEDCVGSIVVAWHADEGVVIKRLLRVKSGYVLKSDNLEYLPIPLTAQWTISGMVRWWLQKAEGK